MSRPILVRRLLCVFVLFSLLDITPGKAQAAEPGWSPVIIATGDYRRQIESTPIEKRPYRPFHFYGNTVRRMYYRGNPLPLPRGLSQTLNPTRLVSVVGGR